MGQFQVAAGRGVDLHGSVGRFALGFAQEGQFALLRDVEVIDDGAHGRDLGPGEGAESIQRGHFEEPAKPIMCPGAVEGPARQRGQGNPEIRDCFSVITLLIVGHQQFGRGEAGQFRAKTHRGQGHHVKRAGRDINPGQRPFVAHNGECGEEIVPARIQQRFLGQGAGCDEAHDIAFDDGFGAALLRLFGGFHLFAHGDAEPLANEGQQVVFRRMHGHAAHRDILAQVFAALGQGDIQRLGRGDRVVEEQLVEIAHPVEQQGIGIALLDLEELGHHRRDGRFVQHAPPWFGRDLTKAESGVKAEMVEWGGALV